VSAVIDGAPTLTGIVTIGTASFGAVLRDCPD